MLNLPPNPKWDIAHVSHSTLVNADCFDVFPFIEGKSIDAIICDLPYGTTACKWDSVLPFDKLWKEYERVIKDNGVIVLFGRNPFFAKLICSNEKLFKYEIIWDKNAGTDFAQANNKPITVHENIALFAKNRIQYKRIDDDGFKAYSDKRTIKQSSELGAKGLTNREPFENKTTRTPTTIRKYFPDNRKGLGSSLHPTQKPIGVYDFCLHFAKAQPQMKMLDTHVGSGSSRIAAHKMGLQYTGFEIDTEYYEKQEKRFKDFVSQLRMF